MKDYYELLEVSKNASPDTIKKVFRMMIKKNHPDLFEGEEKIRAEAKVKELNEAYEILINESSRNKYDLELEEFNKRDDEAIQTLMEENAYLKSVIEEKNRLIREFLEDVGVDTSKIEEDYDTEEKANYYNSSSNVNNNIDMTEGYNSYRTEERIKKIVYILTMIMVGIIMLWITTGINLFAIFIDIFKIMF